MRKQTKLVAVLSAAALLAIGASMTSFAATGWTEEDGTWVYYDKDEYKVTDTWKKSGNYWYFLDEDGYMATSKLVEDEDKTYYVDETGRMVTNQWVELENEDYYDSSDDDDEADTVWYYFQSTGKAYKAGATSTSFKTINDKKYAFDADGQMLFGWVDDNSQRVTGDEAFKNAIYYCGESNDGARVSNAWANLYISDNGPGHELDDQEYVWFWFQTNGKKFVAVDVEVKTKKINGQTYAFDQDGVMRSKWQVATESTASNLSGYFSDLENGARKKGWFQAIPSDVINKKDNEDEKVYWYYGLNNGKVVTSEIKTINGKKYAFNEDAEMMSGLYSMVVNDGNIVDYKKIDAEDQMGDKYYSYASKVKGATAAVYYFGGSDDGALKTGNQNVSVDGDTYQFSFKKDGTNKGQGITSASDAKTLYVLGKKIKADSDYKYQVVDRLTGVAHDMRVGESVLYADYRIVNTSGSVMSSTSTSYKDADGNYYKIGTVDGAKSITYVDKK